MRTFLRRLVWILVLSLIPSGAFADDWVAEKLRGAVFVMVDSEWVKLERGSIVPDDRVIRTMNGRITLTRGAETIDLGPNTQIQIFDRPGRMPFTTVKEYFGTVAVEAEVKQVRHFAVETPHLVAVVKGTRFVVTAGKTSSEVSVNRGSVAVEANETRSNVLLAVGQSVEVGLHKAMQVSGGGVLPPVLGPDGKPVLPDTAAAAARAGGSAGGAGNAGGNSGGAGNAGGNSGNAGNAGNSGDAPGNSGDAPGNSGDAPGNSGDAPGNSGNAGEARGNSELARGNK